MDSTTKNKVKPRRTVTILGVGGHGSSAYIDFLTNPDYENYDIHLVLGVDDSGGHTGALTRTIEYMLMENPEYMIELGIKDKNDLYRILPMGDFRSNLTRFLYFDKTSPWKKDIAELLDMRLNGDGTGLLTNIKELAEKLNYQDIWGLLEFCTLYLEIFEQYKTEITREPSLKHSVGNIFLEYLFIKSGNNQEVFSELLKSMQLLPERIFPHFVNEKRLTLFGEDNAERFIVGEHMVDNNKVEISPKSYGLADLSNEVVPYSHNLDADSIEIVKRNEVNADQLSPVLRALIKDSDLIVLSTGSVANLFPQVKLFQQDIKQARGPLVWLGNIFRGANEVEFQALATYFYQKLGLSGIVLQMDKEDSYNIRLVEMHMEAYKQQWKYPTDIELLMRTLQTDFDKNGLLLKRRMVFPILNVREAQKIRLDHPELRDVLEQNGIKYIPWEISQYSLFILELSLFMERELGLENIKARYENIVKILESINYEVREKKEIINEIKEYREIISDETIDPETRISLLEKQINANNELSLLAMTEAGLK